MQSIAETIAVGFGDGSVRFFQAGHEPRLIKAHEGVVLCMAVNQSYIFTGGDDGKFLRISLSGDVEEIANFGSRWLTVLQLQVKHTLAPQIGLLTFGQEEDQKLLS